MQQIRIFCALCLIAALVVTPASAASDGGILQEILNWLLWWLPDETPEPSITSEPSPPQGPGMQILAEDPVSDPPGPDQDNTSSPPQIPVIGTVYAVDYHTVPPHGSAPFMVRFTSNDTVSGLIIDTYAWTFGDGFSSTERDHFHTYEVEGTYTATLTVCNISTGWNATAQMTITVEPSGVVPLPADDGEMTP